MFGLFKKKKKELDRAAEIVAAQLFTHLMQGDADDIAERLGALQHDKFILGYVTGSAGVAAKLCKLDSHADTGAFISKVLDLLFPDDGLKLLNKVIEYQQSSDSEFIEAAKSGMNEFSESYTKMLKTFVKKDQIPEIELPSFDHYLSTR